MVRGLGFHSSSPPDYPICFLSLGRSPIIINSHCCRRCRRLHDTHHIPFFCYFSLCPTDTVIPFGSISLLRLPLLIFCFNDYLFFFTSRSKPPQVGHLDCLSHAGAVSIIPRLDRRTVPSQPALRSNTFICNRLC